MFDNFSDFFICVMHMQQDLKAVDDECSVALRYQLASYAYTYEQALTEDGLALDNDQGALSVTKSWGGIAAC